MKKTFLLSILFALSMVIMQGCSSGEVDGDNDGLDAGDDVPALDAGTDELPADSSNEFGELDSMSTGTETTDELSDASLDEGTTTAENEWGDSMSSSSELDGTAETTAETTIDAQPMPLEPATTAGLDSMAMGDSTFPTENQQVAQPEPAPAFSSASGEPYTVQQGQTLMQVAFETTGDLYRWREIYEMNRDKISDPNHVPPGTTIQVPAGQRVSITKNGTAYKIRRGDTLGRISNQVYGTPSKWKKIWKNNPELIKDPNKIYAGFYLYYTQEPYYNEPPEVSPQPMAEAPMVEEAPIQTSSMETAPPVQVDSASPADPGLRVPASDPTTIDPNNGMGVDPGQSAQPMAQ